MHSNEVFSFDEVAKRLRKVFEDAVTTREPFLGPPNSTPRDMENINY